MWHHGERCHGTTTENTTAILMWHHRVRCHGTTTENTTAILMWHHRVRCHGTATGNTTAVLMWYHRVRCHGTTTEYTTAVLMWHHGSALPWDGFRLNVLMWYHAYLNVLSPIPPHTSHSSNLVIGACVRKKRKRPQKTKSSLPVWSASNAWSKGTIIMTSAVYWRGSVVKDLRLTCWTDRTRSTFGYDESTTIPAGPLCQTLN